MSQDERITFNKNKDGSWRLIFNGKDLDVSFFVPDGCKIEDYNIEVVSGTDFYKNMHPYKDVVFRLLKEPSEMKRESITIKESGGLTFEKGLVVDIRDELFIGHNKDTIIKSSSGVETNSFICAGNNDSTFNISDFGTAKLVTDKVGISDNVNAKIDLSWRPKSINVFGNVISGTTDYQGIILRGDSVNFDRNEITMKSTNSKLVIDAKDVESIECLYEIAGTLSINSEPSSEEKDKNSRIFLRRGKIIAEDSVLSELRCNVEDFQAEGTLRVNGKSYLVAEGTIWLTGNNSIESSKIIAVDSPLKLVDAFIKSANLSFNKPLGAKGTYNMIVKASVERCDIDHINGVLGGAIERVYGENLNLAISSWIETTKVFSRNDDKIERDYLAINNLSIKENSSLKVCLPTSQGDKPKGVSLENTIVNGNSQIYSDGNLEITNCELKETKIKQKGQEVDTKCSNTSFKNEVALSNVESVNRSVLDNSHISSAGNEPIKVDGENLKDVSNYEDYLGQKYAQTTFVDVGNTSSIETL